MSLSMVECGEEETQVVAGLGFGLVVSQSADV